MTSYRAQVSTAVSAARFTKRGALRFSWYGEQDLRWRSLSAKSSESYRRAWVTALLEATLYSNFYQAGTAIASRPNARSLCVGETSFAAILSASNHGGFLAACMGGCRPHRQRSYRCEGRTTGQAHVVRVQAHRHLARGLSLNSIAEGATQRIPRVLYGPRQQ